MTRFPSVGDQFGEYLISRRIGRGGMGVVFAANHVRLGREVALKVLPPEFAADPDYRHRFGREAAALARLNSPHVIQIYDHGEIDGCLWVATQLVAGGDLGEQLRDHGPMPLDRALDVVIQVASGLADAHQLGVIHRDIKPSNVLLRQSTSGEVFAYLCDFGIAQTEDRGQTRTSGILGTVGYMAPERLSGQDASVASDIYAMGCLLWAGLTGGEPYTGSEYAVMQGHLSGPVPQLAGNGPRVDAINGVLSRALNKDPSLRHSTADEFRWDLVRAAKTPGGLIAPTAQMSYPPSPPQSPPQTPPQGAQQYPPQTPPEGLPTQGAPLQGFQPPGYPPQGTPPQGAPPQGAPAWASGQQPPTQGPPSYQPGYPSPGWYPQPGGQPQQPPPRRRSRIGLIVAIAAVLVIVGGGVWAVASGVFSSSGNANNSDGTSGTTSNITTGTTTSTTTGTTTTTTSTHTTTNVRTIAEERRTLRAYIPNGVTKCHQIVVGDASYDSNADAQELCTTESGLSGLLASIQSDGAKESAYLKDWLDAGDYHHGSCPDNAARHVKTTWNINGVVQGDLYCDESHNTTRYIWTMEAQHLVFITTGDGSVAAPSDAQKLHQFWLSLRWPKYTK